MVAPCCCVCMCVHDVSPTSTVHHSRDRAVICHHTTRACAYYENLAASASCFMSTTSSSQGRRACGIAQPMVGRAEASKRATRAADHLSGKFEPRTEGGVARCNVVSIKQVFVADAGRGDVGGAQSELASQSANRTAVRRGAPPLVANHNNPCQATL